jgi:glycosyltransferase involved in cell wall biosynthesis
MGVSVIVRTYNEEKWISGCLNAIFSQDFDEDFEVIIVDSESVDRTVEIAKEFDVQIIQVPKETFSFGKSLNEGAKFSSGKYIINLSVHAIPANKKWMMNLIENLKNPGVAGAYGKQIPYPNCHPSLKRDLSCFFGEKKVVQVKNPKFSNANAAIKREIWEREKFNERIIAGEDWEWARRVQSLGYRIVYEPNAVVYHSHNQTLSQVYVRSLKEHSTINLVVGPTFNLILLLGTPLTLSKDFKFILANRYNFKWVFHSILYRMVRSFGIISAFTKNPYSK